MTQTTLTLDRLFPAESAAAPAPARRSPWTVVGWRREGARIEWVLEHEHVRGRTRVVVATDRADLNARLAAEPLPEPVLRRAACEAEAPRPRAVPGVGEMALVLGASRRSTTWGTPAAECLHNECRRPGGRCRREHARSKSTRDRRAAALKGSGQ